MGLFRHILSIVALPGMVTIVVPTLILWVTGSPNIGWSSPKPLSYVLSVLGVIFMTGGSLMGVKTVALFAVEGKGTLAPWNPPQKLVIRGVYRNVRNPMITGAMLILFGETLLLGSPWLLAWLGLFAAANFIYMPLIEEPGLERRFGQDYITYKKHVPRWIPRVKPWTPPDRV